MRNVVRSGAALTALAFTVLTYAQSQTGRVSGTLIFPYSQKKREGCQEESEGCQRAKGVRYPYFSKRGMVPGTIFLLVAPSFRAAHGPAHAGVLSLCSYTWGTSGPFISLVYQGNTRILRPDKRQHRNSG